MPKMQEWTKMTFNKIIEDEDILCRQITFKRGNLLIQRRILSNEADPKPKIDSAHIFGNQFGFRTIILIVEDFCEVEKIKK
jgi:hypothetical protein